MQISPLIRKSFPAEGVQVTKENFLDVAEWCGGVVKSREGTAFIKVDVIRPINERQTEAVIGDWVIKVGHGFKVFTPESFERSFEVMPVNEPDAIIDGLVIDHKFSQEVWIDSDTTVAEAVDAIRKGTANPNQVRRHMGLQ